jgi:hypothetical protein
MQPTMTPVSAAVAPGEHDEAEGQHLQQHVDRGAEERGTAQERLPPGPGQPLAQVGAQAPAQAPAQAGAQDGAQAPAHGTGRTPATLHRRPDEGQRGQRGQVRQRVRSERGRPGQPEQRAAQRRPGKLRGVVARLVLSHGSRTLRFVHQHRQRRALREAEQHACGTLDEPGHQHLRVADVPQPPGHGDAADGGKPDRVAADHDPLAVMPVGQAPGRQREEQVAQHAREAGDARLGGRAGHGQHQQRIGDPRGLRAEHGDRLARPQQLKVPVAPQRDRACRTARRPAHGATIRSAARRRQSSRSERNAGTQD